MRNGPNKTSNLKLQTSGKPQASSLTGQDLPSASEYPQISADFWVVSDGEAGESVGRHPFDLEERTARFGEDVVRFSKKVPRDPSNNRLIDQLVGAGTSVGANYLEASERVSKKDFQFTISRCVKEAKETKLFLRMIAASEPSLIDEARRLYREAHELHLIFASMYRKGKQ